MKAAEEGHIPIMKKLLGWCVNLEAKNRKGRTALSLASAPSGGKQPSLSAVRLLLVHGARAEVIDDNGNTAKELARSAGLDEVVKVFEEFV